MVDWHVHDKTYRMLDMDLEFQAKSPFRVGAGKAVSPISPASLQILRISMNDRSVPYIPGSSLKGLFRSCSEFIAKLKGLKVCMIGEECGSQLSEQLKEVFKGRRFEDLKSLLKEKLCIICKLYGTGGYASHVAIHDAYPIGEVPINVKVGIAIGRRSGSVKNLYTLEFVPPGVRFRGKLTLTNAPNYALGLVSYVLEMVNAGIARIGGFKSRGFGVFDVKPVKVEGYVLSDGSLRDLKEVEVFEALDEYDVDVDVSDVKNDPLKFISKFKVAWDNYVSKVSRS
ncbi:MAG: RAMP superfamily CRISPR-associated protein [Thermosphaera sp.]